MTVNDDLQPGTLVYLHGRNPEHGQEVTLFRSAYDKDEPFSSQLEVVNRRAVAGEPVTFLGFVPCVRDSRPMEARVLARDGIWFVFSDEVTPYEDEVNE